MTDGSASVGGALRAGLAEWRPALDACWAALAVAAVLAMVAGWLPAGVGPLAALAAGVIAQGALFRRVFARSPGFKGLRWGSDEWRLLGAHLLALGLVVLIGSILLVVIGAVVLGVARASAPGLDIGSAQAWKDAVAHAGPAGFVVGLAPLAGLAILVWLSLRLSLTAPATVAQGGVRVLSAFPLTKGRVPVLLAVSLVLAAPAVLVGLVLGAASPRGPGAAAVAAAIAYFVLAPVWAGAIAHIYRQAAVLQD
ncbi:hypothetical protein [Caulobacter sp.]|uniref:hypothetical protein n=1 Tax=Caulobacter sp. TaxID=78 RepID=UPI002B46A1B2|nr:hypothetical protein [Caulobacter sp.]HJV40336.1 hypothetical protein [Caulobacter sp.]